VGEFAGSLNCRQMDSPVNYTKDQISAITRGLLPGVQLIIGPPGTGKTDVCVEMARQLLLNFPQEKIIIITHSNAALNDLFEKVYKTGVINQEEIVRLGAGERHLNLDADFSKNGRINHLLEKRIAYLAEVKLITQDIGLNIETEFTCETAEIFFVSQIESRWKEFTTNLHKGLYKDDLANIEGHFPFSKHYFFGLNHKANT
jgi:intron-binding protein aquarius